MPIRWLETCRLERWLMPDEENFYRWVEPTAKAGRRGLRGHLLSDASLGSCCRWGISETAPRRRDTGPPASVWAAAGYAISIS